MTDKLACNNVLSLITADDIAARDLAADYQQWQRGLRSLKRVLMDNDMITPFMIPTQFDIGYMLESHPSILEVTPSQLA